MGEAGSNVVALEAATHLDIVLECRQIVAIAAIGAASPLTEFALEAATLDAALEL